MLQPADPRQRASTHETRNPGTGRRGSGPVSAQSAQPQQSNARKSNKASALHTLLFAVIVLATLGYAWSVRLERHVTAESGLGYALGITGATMLLVVLLYPIRKRWKWLRRLGSVPGWFRLHMFLGILGPSLIILHSNFRLSAINSAVAMMIMLTVVASGMIGRFLYSKIHVGLYGQRTELTGLARDAEEFLQGFGADLNGAPAVVSELRAAEAAIFDRRQSIWGSIWTLASLKWSQRRRRTKYLAEAQTILSTAALRETWRPADYQARLAAARNNLVSYQACLIKAADFRVYERLFSVWHHLHLPLFILFIMAAIVHIFAVHLY